MSNHVVSMAKKKCSKQYMTRSDVRAKNSKNPRHESIAKSISKWLDCQALSRVLKPAVIVTIKRSTFTKTQSLYWISFLPINFPCVLEWPSNLQTFKAVLNSHLFLGLSRVKTTKKTLSLEQNLTFSRPVHQKRKRKNVAQVQVVRDEKVH